MHGVSKARMFKVASSPAEFVELAYDNPVLVLNAEILSSATQSYMHVYTVNQYIACNWINSNYMYLKNLRSYGNNHTTWLPWLQPTVCG